MIQKKMIKVERNDSFTPLEALDEFKLAGLSDRRKDTLRLIPLLLLFMNDVSVSSSEGTSPDGLVIFL